MTARTQEVEQCMEQLPRVRVDHTGCRKHDNCQVITDTLFPDYHLHSLQVIVFTGFSACWKYLVE
ncbi:MAG: hypothetical protein P8Y24_06355 [Gammaproteobacteria bacterium]